MRIKEKGKRKREGKRAPPFSFLLSPFSSRTGFTLLEGIIVLGVFAILAVVGIPKVTEYQRMKNLDLSTDELTSVVRSTRERAVTRENGLSWGIRFSNANGSSSYAVFSGASSASGTIERAYVLRRGVAFTDPAAGAAREVVFQSSTGAPAAQFFISLGVSGVGAFEKVVTVTAQGAIAVTDYTGLSVSSMSPNQGYTSGPTAVASIAGTGFTASATAALTRVGQADIPLVGFTVAGPTVITGGTFNTTNAAAGTWNVAVTTGEGTATLAGGFTLQLPPPSVFGVSPSSGTSGSSLSGVSVTGLYFQSGAFTVQLTRDGEASIVGSGFSFANSTSLVGGILGLLGAAPGSWSVVVTNVDGQSGTLVAGFTVGAVGGPVWEIAAVGSNASVGGSCGGSSAWEHAEVCVNVPAAAGVGTQPLALTSNGYNSNSLSFSVP